MIKNIVIIGIVILFMAGIIWIARPKPQSESAGLPPETLVIEKESFDFGEISMAAGNVSHAFKIKNSGSEPITVKKLYTSCMCTTASLMFGSKKFGPYGMAGHGFIPEINKTIDPGEEAAIEAVFDPAAHGPAGVGLIERAITIENSAGGPVQLNFSAFVKP